MIKEAVGSQDQIAAAFGGLNKIVFSANNIEVNPVTIASEKVAHLQNHLMLFFTGFARFAVEIEKDKLQQLDSKKDQLRTMHQMVDSAIDILNGDASGYGDFGRLLHETWLLKKSLSHKVSTSEIDDIYQRGMTAGALGGKILGAGGGGFILFFVEPEKQARFKSALSPLLHVPFRFDTLGSQVIYYAEP
jgi:D-glycero-alpha-D-manno-heptose-7-phosphate kinase